MSAEQFTVTQPQPPFQRGAPLNSYIIDQNNVKLCQCQAAAAQPTAGIIKVAGKIFGQIPIPSSDLPPVNSPSGLTSTGWQVIDYGTQAQSSIKFQNGIYSGVQRDYRVVGAKVGDNNYLVVLALFRNAAAVWVPAYNANQNSPIQFKGVAGDCPPVV
ncbi:MAG: hypothetical protein ACK6D3_13010 [Planctomycetaceae bacterium]|jgi:hypothetical protein